MAGVDSWLRPFEERASKAEERLDRLEAALAKTLSGLEVGSRTAGPVGDVSKGGDQSEQPEPSFQQKTGEAERLAAENAKLKYQILHLKRSLQEVDERHEKEVERVSADNSKLKYQNLHLMRALKEMDARAEGVKSSGP